MSQMMSGNITPRMSSAELRPLYESSGLVFKMDEIWKPIEGYEGFYEVSNIGRVKSLTREVVRKNGVHLSIKGSIMRPHILIVGKYFKRKYRVFCLSKSGKREFIYGHTLVARAFIPNPENKPCVDHINGTEYGDSVENLRWCTQKENLNFETARKHNSEANRGERHSRYGKFGAQNPTSKSVAQYTKEGEYVQTFGGIREAERKTGIDNRGICACCKGKHRSAGGYVWRYIE